MKCFHRVSKALVREAVENDCTAIAFEKLNYIRGRISNGSKFQRSVNFSVTSNTKPENTASAYMTSLLPTPGCSHGECGFTHEDNRDGDEFEYLKCGKQL